MAAPEATPHGTAASAAGASPERAAEPDPGDASLLERFPRLADLDGMDDDQRIEVFQHVLDTLQRELDEERG